MKVLFYLQMSTLGKIIMTGGDISSNYPPQTTYSCRVCGKHFKTAFNLQIHIRTHTGEKPFSCPVCNRKSNHSSNMTKHVRTVHKMPDYTHCKWERAEVMKIFPWREGISAGSWYFSSSVLMCHWLQPAHLCGNQWQSGRRITETVGILYVHASGGRAPLTGF